MAEILSTDFKMDEIPGYPGQHVYSKYAQFRELLSLHGKLKLKISNPENKSLTKGRHEGSRIYHSLRYWFARNSTTHDLCARGIGDTVWFWLKERKEEKESSD